MNLSQFNEEIRSLDKDFLQSILDGSALLMVEDQSLGLGSSNGAFVIFWIEDEVFSSVEDLRSYLAEEAEDLHANYYKHSPISKEYFEAKLSSLMDEYGQTHGDTPGIVTGKPLELGGSEGREAATGRGTAIITREAAEKWNINLKGAKVVIQGFGNVGSYAAKFLHEYGCKIIGVSDISGGLYDPEGFDLDALFDYNYKNRTIDGYQQGKKITNEQLLALECDFLIPAALGSAITDKNVDSLNCKIIIEAANGPVTGEAADKLWEKKIAIIPDILTNAGGVTVSYFEWVQNLQQFKWPEKEINEKLEQKMVSAFNEVYSIRESKKVPMRIASFMVAIDRVSTAYNLREG